MLGREKDRNGKARYTVVKTRVLTLQTTSQEVFHPGQKILIFQQQVFLVPGGVAKYFSPLSKIADCLQTTWVITIISLTSSLRPRMKYKLRTKFQCFLTLERSKVVYSLLSFFTAQECWQPWTQILNPHQLWLHTECPELAGAAYHGPHQYSNVISKHGSGSFKAATVRES